MGCDYYIIKQLEIYFHYGIHPLFIELERDRGYFDFLLDADDPDYDAKEEEYINDTLKPSMLPIIIYEETEFKSKKLEDKYKVLIDEQLELYNRYHEDKKEWKDVRKITKVEHRYERD